MWNRINHGLTLLLAAALTAGFIWLGNLACAGNSNPICSDRQPDAACQPR